MLRYSGIRVLLSTCTTSTTSKLMYYSTTKLSLGLVVLSLVETDGINSVGPTNLCTYIL